MTRPPYGLCIPVTLVEVVDGDTVRVKLYGKDCSVRIQGYDAPEKTLRGGTTPEEKERGILARQELEQFLEAHEVSMWIPYEPRLEDLLSLNRVKARLFAGENDVTEWMIQRGHIK